MKLHYIILIVCFVLVSCKSNQNNIVYIISDTLVEEYQGMKDAKVAFQQKQMTWQANIDSLQSQYQKALKKEPKKAQLFLQNVNKYRTQIQNLSQQEDQKMTQAVLGQINTFTELYGKKHGYDLILGTTSDGSILYGSDRLDITDQLLIALNHYYATGEVK